MEVKALVAMAKCVPTVGLPTLPSVDWSKVEKGSIGRKGHAELKARRAAQAKEELDGRE